MNFIKKVTLEILSAFFLCVAIPNEFLTFGSPLFAIFSLILHFLALYDTKSFKESIFLCFLWAFLAHILSSFWLANFKDFAIFTLGASALGTGGIHAIFGVFFHLPIFAKKKFLKIHSTQNSAQNETSNTEEISIITENSSKTNFEKLINFTNSNLFKILWFSAVFTAWEFVKCIGFLAYPWGTISMTAYKLKYFVQIVDIGGVKLITFLFCFFASTISCMFLDFLNFADFKTDFKSENSNLSDSDFKKKNFFKNVIFSKQNFVSLKNSILKNKLFLILCAIFIFSAEFYGIFQFNKARKITKNVNTIFIQQNYDPWKIKGDDFSILESQELTNDGIEDFKSQGKQPDLCVWSEGILKFPLPEYLIQYKLNPEKYPLLDFLKDKQIPTIIGAPWSVNLQEMKFSNGAILFDKNANIAGVHTKIHLVPFAERIPLTQYKIVQKILNKVIGFSNGWIPGTAYNVFDVPLTSTENESVKISIPICFEDAFGEIFARLKKNGTELFVNITDDSWSLTKSAEYQHFVIAYFRAIEFRTTLIRSTNSGYTVVVDPSGKIVADLPLFEKAHLSYSVPIFENTKTLYLTFGEWLSYLCLAFMIFVLIKVIFVKK